MIKVKILIPYADGTEIDPRCLRGLNSFKNNGGFWFTLETLANTNKNLARNHLLWGSCDNVPFQNGDFDAFLFVDSDIEANFSDFIKMWALNEPLVFGAYKYKTDNLNRFYVAGNYLQGFPGCVDPKSRVLSTQTGVIEKDWAGFGFTLIRAEVLKNLSYPFIEPRTVDAPKGYHRPRETVFDDLAFCFKAREAGYKILLDCRVKLKHHKRGKMEPSEEKIPAGMSEIKDNLDEEAIEAVTLITSMANRIRWLSENIRLLNTHIAARDEIIEGLKKELSREN